MNALLPLAEQVIVNTLLAKRAPFMRKNKFGLSLMVLSGLLVFMALVFVSLSVYGWLLTLFVQPIAALIMGAGILVLSLFTGLVSYKLLRKRPEPAMQGDDLLQLITEVTDILGEEWAEPIRENPKTAVMLAGLAGFVAGDHIH